MDMMPSLPPVSAKTSELHSGPPLCGIFPPQKGGPSSSCQCATVVTERP